MPAPKSGHIPESQLHSIFKYFCIATRRQSRNFSAPMALESVARYLILKRRIGR